MRRVGLNEAVFREVNERLAGLVDPGADGERLDLVCECGDRECAQRIRAELADYEDARADAAQFLVAPGHAIAEVERVIQKRGDYDLIEKFSGLPREVAEQTDPRR